VTDAASTGRGSVLPLQGLRVVDLTRLVPGALATLMLAELGAEVIKIEDPRGGDPMRALPPLLAGRGLYHLLLDRGKKSATLDLRDPDGRAALDRLLSTADVVMESFRPGAARRLGVAGDQIRDRHPHLVHCAITGYGQTGPYAERPGHDLNYVAVSGLLSADRRDVGGSLPGVFMADVGGGAMHAVIAVLAALVGRARHGHGETIDISMHEASLYWLMLPAARELVEGGDRAQGELPTFGGHACYNVYRTRDGVHLALGALEPKFWLAFCDAVGRPDLRSRQLTDAADQSALIREVGELVASRTRDEWLTLFTDHDVCVTPVNQPSEALRDPHVVARGAVTDTRGTRAIRAPFLRAMPALAPAPALGEHNDEIL
jgi:crotonobetainyl-CoA:carnitine CoA-transferase CaiB-like acyl-CoA transferase